MRGEGKGDQQGWSQLSVYPASTTLHPCLHCLRVPITPLQYAPLQANGAPYRLQIRRTYEHKKVSVSDWGWKERKGKERKNEKKDRINEKWKERKKPRQKDLNK